MHAPAKDRHGLLAGFAAAQQSNPRLWRACLHESGHAVTLLHLNVAVHQMTVDPSNNGGVCSTEFYDLMSKYEQLVWTVGGVAAVWVCLLNHDKKLADQLWPWAHERGDIADAKKILESTTWKGGWDLNSHRPLWSVHFQAAFEQAGAVIARTPNGTRALALKLFHKHRLDGDDALETFCDGLNAVGEVFKTVDNRVGLSPPYGPLGDADALPQRIGR
jgi:hypothetical protein